MDRNAAEELARARAAASDIAELLKLAHGAIERAHAETAGEARRVASRLSRHMEYMRKGAELLRDELERWDAAPIGRAAPPSLGRLGATKLRPAVEPLTLHA